MNTVPDQNELCPCGSGKDYPHCCQGKKAAPGAELEAANQKLQSAFAQHQAGRVQQAEAMYRQALKLAPNHPDALYLLGVLHDQTGRGEAAIVLIRRAIDGNAGNPFFHEYLGTLYKSAKRLVEAEACYRRALAINPDSAELNYNLGVTLQDLERPGEAEKCYRRALVLRPDLAQAHYNLGGILKDGGQLGDAEANYRRAAVLKPDYAEAHNNLGNVLKEQGRLGEAETSLRRALAINPDYAKAHNNLGALLVEQGRPGEAEASYRRALALAPDYAEAQRNLGLAFLDLGRVADAEAAFRRALEIRPDDAEAFGHLLFALNYHPDKSAEEIFAAYREYDTRFGLPWRSEWRGHGNDRNPGRRLKVGYVSPDFNQHSARHCLEPLLAHHDREALEVFAYAELLNEDAVTARYKTYVDQWVPTRGMSDQSLAERIRSDGIDILVDLAGHTTRNRLQVLARKPAPVSVSFMGYGYTTGLSAVDYFLTDAASAPEGSDALFSETPWRIETPQFVYRPAPGMGPAGPAPAAERGYVTFGSLTRAVRINHRTVRVWSEILQRVDASRLVVDSRDFRDAVAQDALAQQFAAHGISRDRLEIGCHSPPWDVLRGLDIGLDCFPHNSALTLFETLYMGVPVVTLAGRPSVGRLASTLLQGAGHPEWIARSEEAYVEKAVALARDLPRLAALRECLRAELEAAPLMDEPALARKLEAAFREMWIRWCGKTSG